MATFRKVPHDLLDVAGAGTLYVAGSPSAKNVLIFCAGWPDKQDAFLPLAARLEKECGWTPAETFETGLRKTVRWYLDNGDWVSEVRSGDYRRWIEQNYGDREGA